jgi:hypothetical protein
MFRFSTRCICPFVVTLSHVNFSITERIKNRYYQPVFRIRIRIGSGFNWVSGSKSKLAAKKGKMKKFYVKESEFLCRGLRRHILPVPGTVFDQKTFPIMIFCTNFVILQYNLVLIRSRIHLIRIRNTATS